MGSYKLKDLRSKALKDQVDRVDNEGMRNLQMTLINDYLNGYNNKL